MRGLARRVVAPHRQCGAAPVQSFSFYIGSQHAAAAEREGSNPSCRDERIAFRLSRRGMRPTLDTPAATAVLRFWVSNIIFEEDNES